jgi:hypothetical protein
MESYIYPTIASLPLGYNAEVPFVFDQLQDRVAVRDAEIEYRFDIFREGNQVGSETRKLRITRGKLAGEAPAPFRWKDPSDSGEASHAYGELHCTAVDGRSIFSSKTPLSLYVIYTKPGKKSFFSDPHYKYGSPPVIDQMAEFGQYVETYPVIHLDRARDLGESLVFINPYNRAINVRVLAYDGRSIPKFQIPPLCCRHVPLAALLGEGENEWMGQIQLTANNRLIVFHVKHSLANPRLISDHEHLDPFRAEPTHWPLTLLLRTGAGHLVSSVRRQIRAIRVGA